MKVPISERALTQRINRVLANQGRKLKALRGDRGWDTLGNLYVVELATNSVVKTKVNLEELGRELGVMKGYEELVFED